MKGLGARQIQRSTSELEADILHCLRHPRTTEQLASLVPLSRGRIAMCVHELQLRGLVVREREGKGFVYRRVTR